MTEFKKLVMDDKYITENHILQRYLHNKLTPEETVEFEEHILDKPDLLEQLELDSVLVKTLPEAFEHKQASNEQTTHKHPFNLGILKWWTPLYSHITTVVACTCLITLLVIEQNESTPAHNNFSPKIVYLETYRSAKPATSILFSQQELFKVVVLDIPLEYANKAVQLSIKNELNKAILIQDLTAFDDGSSTFILSKSLLTPAMYDIHITHEGKNVLSFPLQVSFER